MRAYEASHSNGQRHCHKSTGGTVAEGKILVVEDGVSTGRMIGLILTDAGYEVIGPAISNMCAVDLIASNAPNAAFLDVTLGSVTSFPIAELLTSLGIPFAFLTGEDRGQLPLHLRDVLFLSKPVGFDDLLAAAETLTARNVE